MRRREVARCMALRVEIETHVRLEDYAAVASLAAAARELEVEAAQLVKRIQGRTLWMLSSTARGGGVAEMLPSMVTVLRDLGVATEWAVIETDRPEFFELTKRLHNMIHGEEQGELSGEDRALYDAVSRANADALRAWIRPTDMLVVHDPQPLGAGVLLKRELGVPTVWRCHIGLDSCPPPASAAWEFLRPYVTQADYSVFSAAEYIPSFLSGRAAVIYPSIDPLGHKNRDLTLHKLVGVLCDAGLTEPHWPLVYEPFASRARRLQPDGTWAVATQPDLGLLGLPTVVQISRWDRLKGFVPLLEAFQRLKEQPPRPDASAVHRRRIELVKLVLAGPDPAAIADDPEGQEVVRELRERILGLPPPLQRDVALLALPMSSLKENALMVNALQRAATIVVQNSLREGFGLTVAEAMWKRAPVLANSRAVGLRNQVRDAIDGRLVGDPTDVEELARVMDEMLAQPHARDRWGTAGQRRVYDEFLLFAQLRRWIRLIAPVVLR